MGDNTPNAFINDVAIGNGESQKRTLRAPDDMDVDNLNIIANRASTAYDVNIIWCDANFNEILTESISSGVAGGTQDTSSTSVRSRYAKVEVADQGGGSGNADMTATFE